jgi:hypothetical protein
VSELREALENYLAIRRCLGADLESSAYELRRFVTFMESESATHMTTELTLRCCNCRMSKPPLRTTPRNGEASRPGITRPAL